MNIFSLVKIGVFPITHSQQNGGFTLIELLVVVLIIGILAAVALPQYQKAVEKARMTEVSTVFNAVQKAEALYYNEYGHFADLADLNTSGSISIPNINSYTFEVGKTSISFSFSATRDSGKYANCTINLLSGNIIRSDDTGIYVWTPGYGETPLIQNCGCPDTNPARGAEWCDLVKQSQISPGPIIQILYGPLST